MPQIDTAPKKKQAKEPVARKPRSSGIQLPATEYEKDFGDMDLSTVPQTEKALTSAVIDEVKKRTEKMAQNGKFEVVLYSDETGEKTRAGYPKRKKTVRQVEDRGIFLNGAEIGYQVASIPWCHSKFYLSRPAKKRSSLLD